MFDRLATVRLTFQGLGQRRVARSSKSVQSLARRAKDCDRFRRVARRTIERRLANRQSALSFPFVLMCNHIASSPAIQAPRHQLANSIDTIESQMNVLLSIIVFPFFSKAFLFF